VGVYHTIYSGVSYANRVTPVRKCAALKPNSDGSGGNIAIDCPSDNRDARFVLLFSVGGYATGINNSSNYHTGFFGAILLG